MSQSLKEISLDTLNILKTGSYEYIENHQKQKVDILFQLYKSVENTQLFPKYFFDLKIPFSQFNKFISNKNICTIVNGTTIESALNMKKQGYDNICILNFASRTKAGGGWLNGAIAQEEDIMRKTTGFLSIVSTEGFYSKKFKQNPIYDDAIIYSPNILIIRNNQNHLIKPVEISMITSAAVNKSRVKTCFPSITDNQIYDIMKERIRKILEVAIINKQKCFVLGAFGCGVFGNEPESIAQIFEELLIKDGYNKFFDKIEFAVLDNSKNLSNLKAFQSKFS